METIHITENAVRNREELFPNHESKLQKTDPEFIALFDDGFRTPSAAGRQKLTPGRELD